MRFYEIQPFVRFASLISFAQGSIGRLAVARDCRLFFVYSGRMRTENDAQEYELQSGDCIYIPAGSPYRLEFPEETQVFIVNFDFDRSNSTSARPFPPMDVPAPEEIYAVPEIEDARFFENTLFFEQMQAMQSILQAMEKEHAEAVMFSEKLISVRMTEALIMIARAQLSEDAKHPQAIETMMRFIRENIRRPIRNQDVAMTVNYHPNYANSLFFRHTGQTIHQYLIGCRVQRALELLLSTELSITEVALEVGFSSLNRFSKEFTARMGNTPGKYRKRT